MSKIYKHNLILDSIELNNFRRFKNINLDFDEKLTVLIGENGSGKTTILEAIGCILQKFISSFYKLKDEFEIDFSDIKIGSNRLGIGLSISANYTSYNYALLEEEKANDNTVDENDDKYYSEISSQKKLISEFDKDSIKISLAEEDSLDSNVLSEFGESIKNLLVSKKNFSLPVFIIFRSESEVNSRIRPSNEINEIKPSDILKVYDRFINPEINSFIAINEWFRWQEGLKNQRQRENKPYEDKALKDVKRAIYKFLHNNIEAEESELDNSVYVDWEKSSQGNLKVKKDGNHLYFYQLSSGERKIATLIFEIARRLSMANSQISDPLTNGNGIVMIDEIDLHLHPKWQRLIIPKLREIFPNVQFVVTTHSPLILGEVSKEQIRILHNGKIYNLKSQTYGRDISEIIENIMGVPLRNEKIQKKIDQYFELIAKKQLDAAELLRNDLEKIIGNDDPVFVRADGIIKRIKVIGK